MDHVALQGEGVGGGVRAHSSHALAIFFAMKHKLAK